MGTPFATETLSRFTAPNATIAATDAQLRRAISPMLTERDWSQGVVRWTKRVAVIAATLHIAEQVAHDEHTAQQLKVELFDRSDLWLTFHQLMEHNQVEPLTKAGASKLIDYLRTLPTKAQVTKEATARGQAVTPNQSGFPRVDVVPAGRYAIETFDGAHNDLAFYKVDRPTEGRWAGYVFVKLMISDDEQRVPFAMAKGVMRRIAEVGAEAASARYGLEFVHCGVCGRGLTNDASRKRGIGPDCAKKMGW